MVSKSTSILLAVAVVAVSAVAIIGLGYAYTASTENSGNTTAVKYITLTPNEGSGESWSSSYTGAFDNPVKYNTVNNGGTITYTVNTEQIVDIDGDGNGTDNGILLGTAKIVIAPETGGTVPAFKFSVARTAGTMTGTYKIAYSTSENSGYNYRSFSFDNASTSIINYYASGDGDAVTNGANAGTFSAGTTEVYVKLFYVVGANPEGSTTLSNVTPLSGVTFQFKAEVPEA